MANTKDNKKTASRAGIFLGLAILALLVWAVDWRELAGALAEMTLALAVLLLLLSVVLVYISALKWKIFLEVQGPAPNIGVLFRLYLVGYFVNLILPSYLGGDAVRSWYVGTRVGQHEAAAATILERYTGIVAMLILALVSASFSTLITWEMFAAVVVATLGLAGVTLAAIEMDRVPGLTKLLAKLRIEQHCRKVRAGLLLAGRNPKVLVQTLLLSLLFHTFTVANTIAAAHAVGWTNPPPVDLFVVLPLILVLGSIPLTPNGIGLQEGIFFYFLHALGASDAQALGVPIILRAKAYVLALFGGVAWLTLRAETSTKKAELPETATLP